MFRSLFRKLRKSGQAARRPGYRPFLEGLEIRITPTLRTVGPGQQFATITAAVNAATPGDQVEVFNGANGNAPYVEQVFVNKNLQMFAAPNNTPIIQAPANLTSLSGLGIDPADDTQAIVTVYGSSHPSVTIQGFIVNGALLSTVNSPLDAGIYVRDAATVIVGGTSATAVGGAGANPSNIIENVRLANLANAGASQTGIGILVGQVLTDNQGQITFSTTGHATITGNTIFQYQKDGISLQTGSSALIQSNNLFGLGRQGSIAQNGIDAENALVVALGNFIRFHEYAPPNGQGQIPANPANDTNANPFDPNTFQAGGILVNTASVGSLISGNILDANDFGIDTFNTGVGNSANLAGLTLSFNQLGFAAPNRYEGIIVDQGVTNLVSNTIYGGNSGIFAASFSGSTDNTTAFFSGNVVALTNVGLLAQNDPAGTSFNPLLTIGSPRGAANTVTSNSFVYNGTAGIKLDAGVETIQGNQINSNGVGVWVTGGVTQVLSLNAITFNSSDQVRVTGGFVPAVTDNDLSFIASKAINNQTTSPILAPSNYYLEIGYSSLTPKSASQFASLIQGFVTGPVDTNGFLLTKPIATLTGVVPNRNELYPTHLSLDLLGATPDPVTYFNEVSQLVNGATLNAVATSVVNSSVFIDHQISLIYQNYLGRVPTAAELTSGENVIATGGSYDSIRITVLSTAEFFNKAGGTNTGFVNLLFQDVLGRAPSQAELNANVASLNGGTPRSTVAANVVLSGEAQVRRIIVYYQNLLNRIPTQAEINAGLAQPSEQALIVSIVSMTEYYNKLP